MTEFDLDINRSRSIEGHHLNKLDKAKFPMRHTKVLFLSFSLVLKRAFTIYWHGGYLGHVTKIP